MNDKPIDIEDRFRKMIMARSPQDRLTMACGMFATAKALVCAGIKEGHDLMDPYELRKQMFCRIYGHDIGENEKAKILDSWNHA